MQEINVVTKLFVFFLSVKLMLEIFLEIRNKKHILENKDEVPQKFREKITLAEHQKAASYSIAKINAGKFFRLTHLFILLLWTLGGGLNLLDQYVRGMNLGPIAAGLFFFGAFVLVSMILGLPESLYSTFVLEEKFGFNKTTPKTFVIDMFKGLVLGAVIGLPLLACVLWIMERLGNNWWLFAWALMTAFQFLIMWAYPTLIAPLFNKFGPLEEGELKEKILGLLQRTEFQSKGLFVMDASKRSTHGNAYFTGLGKSKRIVFFDTLIKNLDPEEVEAVLAHELGHFKRKHVLKGLVRSIVMGLIGFFILGYVYDKTIFFTGHGVSTPSAYAALLLFSMVTPVYTFLATPLSAFISRKYEFEADSFAAQFAKAPKLISALVKLYRENASTLTPDPVYSAFYHSHPPALIRVKFLEGLEQAKSS